LSDITIVTAFFDIGRGDWTPEKGLPHYLERSVDTYVDRFSHLAQLDNEMVIFTTEDLIEKIKPHRQKHKQKTKYVTYDPRVRMVDVRDKIIKVQTDPEFQKKILISQSKNPEYWNPDYVLVTNLKAYFVNASIKNGTGLVSNDMVAWIDFGYCRDSSKIPASQKWEYDFDPNKIHMFNYKPYDGKPIEDIVAQNDVYILGAKVVAHKYKWADMERLMWTSFNDFQRKNIVDDDQGLWLNSYLLEPDLFELHSIPDHQKGHDPFVLFNKFNSTVPPEDDLIRINTI
jgi:protein YibB